LSLWSIRALVSHGLQQKAVHEVDCRSLVFRFESIKIQESFDKLFKAHAEFYRRNVEISQLVREKLLEDSNKPVKGGDDGGTKDSL
jgi:hypothetical protein